MSRGYSVYVNFFFQAEDGIRYGHVTGVQTCALPISGVGRVLKENNPETVIWSVEPEASPILTKGEAGSHKIQEIGRASCRERVKIRVGARSVKKENERR